MRKKTPSVPGLRRTNNQTVRIVASSPHSHNTYIRRAARLLRDERTKELIDASHLRYVQWRCR
jgi:hypothetical protein